jgi:uncharacterized protein YjiS (DUF1127 family)
MRADFATQNAQITHTRRNHGMAANIDLLRQTPTGTFDRLAQALKKVVTDIGLSYRQATSRNVVQSLSERQLRDVGIDQVNAAQGKDAAAKAVLLANLSSMR